jgi:hypothetical protein
MFPLKGYSALLRNTYKIIIIRLSLCVSADEAGGGRGTVGWECYRVW